MDTARIFVNGGSQAVRLPKDCRFNVDEVLVNRIGSTVILMPKDDPWSGMLDCLANDIDDLPVQERSGL